MTEHIQEEQLILHYYGEASESPAVEAHIASCDRCRAEYHTLQRVLNSVDSAPVPSRGADYGRQVWDRVSPKLPGGRRKWFAFPQRWVAAAAMAALVIGAFLAGRYSLQGPVVTPAPMVAGSEQVRDGILLVSVGEHLERSHMVLTELANSSGNQVNITPERELAGSLVEANRLYRQTATAAGETSVVNILDDLERVLIEISNSPESLSGAQLAELRRRIDEQGLLFKVQIIGSQLRDRGERPAVPLNKTKL
jgi:anti-sigma factor RsiW